MPFVKGKSGNPGGGFGRHAVRFAEKLRCGPTDDALNALLDAVANGDGPTKIAAAKEILARGIGKPLEVNVTLADFTDDEIWSEMERRLQAKNPNAPAASPQEHAQ